jgi:hypothetical protein
VVPGSGGSSCAHFCSKAKIVTSFFADTQKKAHLNVRFTVELTREEHARLPTALEKAGAEMAPSLAKTQVDPRRTAL